MAGADDVLLGKIALETRVLNPKQLDACIAEQQRSETAQPLGKIMLQLGFVNDDQLAGLLAEQRRRLYSETNKSLFGRIAVDRGLINEEQLQETVRDLMIEQEAGRTAAIGMLLVKKGFLTREQFTDVLKLQQKSQLKCDPCDKVVNVYGVEEDAVVTCPSCERPLRDPSSIRKPDQEIVPPDPSSGTAVGGYEIVGDIARGDTANLFRAVHAKSGLPVALKILKNADRYTAAAKAAQKLQHSNIVRCLGGGRVGRIATVATELIEGTPIDALGRSTTRDRVGWVEAAARAVDHAAAEGVPHGNLKPSNILVDAEGTVKVTDFGLAPIGDNAPYGTADIPALGMILHQMVGDARGGTPADLRAVVDHALAGGYETAGSIADDLAAYLEGRPVSVKPKRDRTLLIVIGGVVLAIAALAIFLATR